MKSVAKLKDEARKNEQAEEWEQAIEAYDEVLRVTDNAEAELPLYNRIGDLFVRMGRPADAVAYYERAADHYAEAGLYNNAIALCNKALRYVPNRLELLRKLGQFSGAQGFLTDARRWYLEYAERQMKNGEIDDAFTALEDFATVYEDAEIRELMGRQFRAHNRIGPAVVALKRAHALRVQAGENAAAAALKDEILKLMPDAFSANTDALATAPAPPVAPARERVELPGYADPPPAPSAPPAYSAGSTPAEKPDTIREPEPQTESPLARDEVFEEEQPETAGLDFDQDLARAELDRALGYETAAPPVEAPVFDAVAPATVENPAFDQIETEPEFEAPEPTGTQESEFSGVEGFEPEENAFTIDLPPLDLPPFELPPLDLPLVPESEPLPFLTFDEPGTASGSTSNDDLLPLLEFDPGPRAANRLGDLPQFETPEPMEPIDLDAAFASMKPFGTPEPKAPVDDVWKQPPAWLQPAPVEPSAPAGDIEPFVTGTESPWAEPLEFGYAPPPSAPERIEVPPPRPQPIAQPDPVEPVTPEPAAAEPPSAKEFVAQTASVIEPPRGEPIQAFEPEPEPEPLPELESPVEELEFEDPEPEFLETEPASAESDFVSTVEVGDPELESWEVAGADAVPQQATAEPFEPVAQASAPIEPPAAPVPHAVPREEPPIPQPLIPAAEFARIQQQIHSGDDAGALERLEVLHSRLAADGRYQEAWHACELILQIEAGNVRALQQRVEYATALGQRDLLLRSYLELARYWRETGAEKKAAIIYQRVLEIDPYNAEAKAVVHGAEVPQATQGYVDLLALISDEAEDASTRFVVAEKAPTGDEERDFADMLAQFKQKVSENLSLSDTNAHYDLGLAFKEMGLIDEAIAEFQTAIKGGGERLKFYEELGQCFLIKQQYNVAVNVLNRALQMPIDEEGHLIGVYYSLGRSYEELGRPAQAREAYERVIGLDINFQDASQRLASL